jgi:hypothetical protein
MSIVKRSVGQAATVGAEMLADYVADQLAPVGQTKAQTHKRAAK